MATLNLNKQGVWTVSNDGSLNENLFVTIPQTYNSTAYLAYKINLSELLQEGQTYTIQFWDVDVSHTGKTADNLGIDAYWGGGSLKMKNWHGTDYFTDGHADYLVGTFIVTNTQATHAHASNLFFNIYNSVSSADGTKNMSIGRWKLEKGDKATLWTPNPSDTDYIPVSPTSGIIETGNIARIYSSRMDAHEFYEI